MNEYFFKMDNIYLMIILTIFLLILTIGSMIILINTKNKGIWNFIFSFISFLSILMIVSTFKYFYKSDFKERVSEVNTYKYNIHKLNDTNRYYKIIEDSNDSANKIKIAVNSGDSIVVIDNCDLTINHNSKQNSLEIIDIINKNWAGEKRKKTKYILYLKD